MLSDQESTIWRTIIRFKGTIAILILILTIGFWTNGMSSERHSRLLGRIGMDYGLLRAGHLWHLLTGTWFQSRAGIAISMVLLVLSGTVLLEYFVGTKRMLMTVITGDWVATVMTALTIRLAAALGWETAVGLLHQPDAGSSALAHAGLGATAVLLPGRWSSLALVSLAIFTVAQFWVETPTPAIVHCWAALYGVLIGGFILRRETLTKDGAR